MHLSQIDALLILLSDPDQFVADDAYKALVAMGDVALPKLHAFAHYSNYDSPLIEHEIVEDLIFDIQVGKIANKLQHWAKYRSGDLWEALCLVNNVICPELGFQNAQRMLDIIYRKMSNNITPIHTPNKAVCYMNEILFKEQHYQSQIDRSDPQLYFVSDVISGHVGSPLLITALYYLLARRLHLQAWLFELQHNIVILGFENIRQYKFACTSNKIYKIGFYLYPPQEGRRYLLSEIAPKHYHANALLPINHVRLIQLIIEELALTYETNFAYRRSNHLLHICQKLNPFAGSLP